MSTSTRACPGESFAAGYTAVLKDGSLIPFETRYDEDHPPRWHVVFLQLSSKEATPLEGGGWTAARDPLATAITGFRLTALLKATPSITTSTVLAPDYRCLQHAFVVRGVGAGWRGSQGRRSRSRQRPALRGRQRGSLGTRRSTGSGRPGRTPRWPPANRNGADARRVGPAHPTGAGGAHRLSPARAGSTPVVVTG